MSSHLFQPIDLAGLTLPNRIIIAPMCQYSADDGNATDWHMVHLGHLALSGAGLLILEATAVEASGRITSGDLGLYSDSNEAALKNVLATIRRYSDIPVGVQLAHAGRKASSAAPWEGGPAGHHRQGRLADRRTLRPRRAADRRAAACPGCCRADPGARCLRRRDAPGAAHRAAGDRASRGPWLPAARIPLPHREPAQRRVWRPDGNRMRFPLEVFEAVRAAVPAEIPVGVRVSSTDWVEHGWDIEQTVMFAKALKDRGCDFMDASSGGVSPAQTIPLAPGYQVEFAARIKAETGMPTMAVGLITEAQHAEAILAEGKADMISMARAILYDPRWPWHAAAELGATVSAPKQYWRSQPRGQAALFGETRLGQR